MNENDMVIGIMVLSFILGLWLGVMWGLSIGKESKDAEWQKIMIEKGYAEMVPDESHKVFKWKN